MKKKPDVFSLRDTWIETPRPSIPDPSRQHAFNGNGSITYDRGNDTNKEEVEEYK